MTRADVIASVVARANTYAHQHGRTWTASELCWCGMPLWRHVELGCTRFLATSHEAGTPGPISVERWDPWSFPSHWMAL